MRSIPKTAEELVSNTIRLDLEAYEKRFLNRRKVVEMPVREGLEKVKIHYKPNHVQTVGNCNYGFDKDGFGYIYRDKEGNYQGEYDSILLVNFPITIVGDLEKKKAAEKAKQKELKLRAEAEKIREELKKVPTLESQPKFGADPVIPRKAPLERKSVANRKQRKKDKK